MWTSHIQTLPQFSFPYHVLSSNRILRTRCRTWTHLNFWTSPCCTYLPFLLPRNTVPIATGFSLIFSLTPFESFLFNILRHLTSLHLLHYETSVSSPSRMISEHTFQHSLCTLFTGYMPCCN